MTKATRRLIKVLLAASVLTVGVAFGGAYVVGDVSAGSLAPGINLTLHGPQWSDANQLSGGPAPADFDGFENTVLFPNCANLRSWAAPAHFDNPLVRHTPSYTAVLVTSTVTDHHHLFVTGDTQHIVVVRTNAGNPLTGTIVATLC